MAPQANAPEYWLEATRELSARDRVLASLIPRHRALAVGSRGDAFQTLARAIVGQQISVKAAQNVWARLIACVGLVTPQSVVGIDPLRLREAGLSARKVQYVRDLAQGFREGRIDAGRWPEMADEDIIEQLTRVRGVGRWTAEMFLIFSLARPDVLPIADLGLQRALRINYNRGRPISARRMHAITQPWMPWRSVATWYMWRSLEPPVDGNTEPPDNGTGNALKPKRADEGPRRSR